MDFYTKQTSFNQLTMSTFNINKACVINNFFGRSGGDGGYDSNCEEEEPSVQQHSRAPSIDRDMRRAFSNGDVIRHNASGTEDTWFGYYRSDDNRIVANGIIYKSLSGFCKAHYSRVRPDRSPNTNGWIECNVMRDGVWVNCDTL